MIIVGVDPGLSGAIALLRKGKFLGLHDMPVVPKAHGKGNEVDPSKLNLYLSPLALHPDSACCIERVAAMPKQGVSSVFAFGRAAGVVEGVVATFARRTEFVRPQAWKKEFGLLRKDKGASIGVARQLFPEAQEQLTRKKDDGRADALLIAEYMRRGLE